MPRVFIVRAIALLLATVALDTRQARAHDEPLPTVLPGFIVETIAHVPQPRELAATPNGDLLVGSLGRSVYIVAHAVARAAEPRVFATVPDGDAAGIALGPGALYIGSNRAVWRTPYTSGDRSAVQTPQMIAAVRPGGDRGHRTTSVAVAGDRLFASVGSSCNACHETDPTRATVQEMRLDGHDMHAKATHIRNAIALAADPRTGTVWAGVAGQDGLRHGHPYEIFDTIADGPETSNYGWPTCYEDRKAVSGTNDCSSITVPHVVFPAHSTPIGAVFYTVAPDAAHAFPTTYRGGAFVTLHGSWHAPPVAPLVVFVPMAGNEPAIPVDWNDPTKQWHTFVGGFAHSPAARSGRPTGIAVAPDGSLFVADDLANVVYRIRPTSDSSGKSSQ